jgi:hypothetical protein
MLEHTNEIAIKILSEEHWDYRVKPENRWHYDTQYKMLVKAIELSKLSQHDVSGAFCDCIEEYDLHRPLGNTIEYCTHCGLKAK